MVISKFGIRINSGKNTSIPKSSKIIFNENSPSHPDILPAQIALGPIYPTHYLNKWLVRKGVDVTVYTTNLDERKVMDVPINQPVFIDGVRVFYFPASFPSRWFYSRELRRALKKNLSGFDIVHITSVFLAFSALGAHYAKKFGKPYIISPHGSLMKEPLNMKGRLKKMIYLNLAEKRNLAGAAAIHFTVEVEKAEYLESGLPLKKSFVIPNGFDPEEFDKAATPGLFRKKYLISDDKKIILFLGRINWKKGFDTLIPTLRKIADEMPSAILVIAGADDDGYKKQVESWIKENNLEKTSFYRYDCGRRKNRRLPRSRRFSSCHPIRKISAWLPWKEHMEQRLWLHPKVGISPYIEKYGRYGYRERRKKICGSDIKDFKNPLLKEQFKAKGREMIQKNFHRTRWRRRCSPNTIRY